MKQREAGFSTILVVLMTAIVLIGRGNGNVDVLGQLGIADQIVPKLEYAASGQAVMARIADGTGMLDMGVMQISEIIGCTGIALAGPLPPGQQRLSIYSAGLAIRSALPDLATAFIRQLTGPDAHAALTAAGFEVG